MEKQNLTTKNTKATKARLSVLLKSKLRVLRVLRGSSLNHVLACALIIGAAARADEIDVLNKAIEDYNDGKNQRAAQGFYKIEETSTVADNRFKAEYYLAQALSKLGFGFSSFFYYGQIIKAGPSHPYYFKSVEGATRVTDEYRDEVLGPNVLNKAYNPEFAKLGPEVLSKINYYISLLGYRAGRYTEAEQFLQGVPPESAAYAKAHYLHGLLEQRKNPEKAVAIFRDILGMNDPKYLDLKEAKELTHLALGRTLYALGRFSEASVHYAQLPRFSRHWDEALFEGAYSDLLNEDPGGALGKLHSLHSPHLSDEFAPESQTLAAIIYYQHCLHGQVREVVARFDREYVPMRDAVKRLLEQNPPLEAYAQLVAPEAFAQGAAPLTVGPLPGALKHHLAKNERISSLLGYVERLDAEARRIKRDGDLMGGTLGQDLLDLIGKQRALVVQVAGKFLKGRLADVVRRLDELDGQKEIIAFETTKGEKEFLEQNVNVRSRLLAQRLHRPAMPAAGHEYWPFDGEYWPDEIGYYRYTLKNACSPKRKED